MTKTRRRTDRFRAVSDLTGQQTTINEYTEFLEVVGTEIGSTEVAGLRGYATDNGNKLNVIGEGVYQDRLTAEVFRRVP